MMIGYARVSTEDQSMDLQTDALKSAGCDRVFSDIASGSVDARRGLLEAASFAREGDTIVVWKLDRFGRSLKSLIDNINELNARGVEFKSIQEALDTRTPSGKLLFHIMGALAEFERAVIGERTRAGLEAARARGRIGGRPLKLGDQQLRTARTLLVDGKTGVGEVAKILNVSRSTLYRRLHPD